MKISASRRGGRRCTRAAAHAARDLDKLNAAMTRILQTPEMRELLARAGSEPAPGTPEQRCQHIASEIQRLEKIAKSSVAGGQ